MPGLRTTKESTNPVQGYPRLFVKGLMGPYMQNKLIDASGKVIVAHRFQVEWVHTPGDRILGECFRSDHFFPVDMSATYGILYIVWFILVYAVEPKFPHGQISIFEEL